jgi:hypothetical protein
LANERKAGEGNQTEEQRNRTEKKNWTKESQITDYSERGYYWHLSTNFLCFLYLNCPF